MIRNIACMAVVCLLLTGCTGLAGSSRGPGGGWHRIAGRLGSPPSKQSFSQAVEKDPFPRAGQGELRP